MAYNISRRAALGLATAAAGGLVQAHRLASAQSDTVGAAFDSAAAAFETAARVEGVVGGSLCFKPPASEMLARHFGHADLEQNRPVSAETIYHWASITKTITAIGAMQLAGRGRIDLDAPVSFYLPETRQIRNPFGGTEDLRVSHLLSHSSGLRAGTWPWSADAGADAHAVPFEPPRWEQLAAMMPYTELGFAPGSRYSYSNPGMALVGRIIECVAGEAVEVFLDKNVLRPLGMTKSYYDLTPWHLRRDRSNSYAIDVHGERQALGAEFDTGVTVANSGLNAPISDMSRYLDFLAGVNPVVEILPRAILQRMWRPRFQTDHDPSVDERMASSFFTIDCRGADGRNRRFVGHTGSQQGFRAFIYVHRRSQAWALMVVNTAADPPRPLVFNTRRRLFVDVFPLLSEVM